MGLSIFSPAPKAPIPRPVRLQLTCDAQAGLFPCGAVFESDQPYMEARSTARRLGWVVTDMGEVFCGACAKRRGG